MASGDRLHGWAEFGPLRARGVLECIDLRTQADRLSEGLWFVVAAFAGLARAWRFAEVTGRDLATPEHDGGSPVPQPPSGYPGTGWTGPGPDAWSSSATREQYVAGVAAVRERIRSGDVYQVNLCRVLEAVSGAEPDAYALAAILARGNPAPYGGLIHVPATTGVDPVWLVTASPELFLARDGDTIASGPIKGTAPTAPQLLPKDRAENVMITDLVRNDLQRVCRPGTVSVDRLLALEEHPGLVHLVSTVSGTLEPDVGWGEVLEATFPPASVSGAPKLAALDVIDELEPADRGPYCGAVGWIDGDNARARLAVGIRTFWWADGRLRFGTGAGITWGSDPEAEWEETELKARRLIGLASRHLEEQR